MHSIFRRLTGYDQMRQQIGVRRYNLKLHHLTAVLKLRTGHLVNILSLGRKPNHDATSKLIIKRQLGAMVIPSHRQEQILRQWTVHVRCSSAFSMTHCYDFTSSPFTRKTENRLTLFSMNDRLSPSCATFGHLSQSRRLPSLRFWFTITIRQV